MREKVKLCKLFERPDFVLNRTFRYQLLATLSVNIITFSHGIGIGWFSPTLTKLQSIDSPLDFTVAIAEASWIGSLIGLGSLCGNIVIGTLLDQVGRKTCIYIIAVPHICLWILIYCARSVEFLYVARFLGGFTGGSSYVVLPIFISEIADMRIRGTLASMLMLSVNFGVLTGFVLSTHLDYHVIPFIIVVLPIVYIVAALFFPETPQHLLRKGKAVDAENAFKYYKNCTNSINHNELQKCKQEFEELQTTIAKRTGDNKLSYKDFITSSALKALCTAFVLLIVNQFCGIFAFVNYMSHIFAESGSIMDPNNSTIIMGVVQIFGAYAATLFVDRYGRKILMLISTGGVCLGLTSFGIFTFCAKSHDLSGLSWVPLVLMTIIVFLANMGIVALTFVILVEIFPAKIRSVAASLCMSVLSFFVFVMLKIFPIYMYTFGISITMWSCAAVTFLCFVYFATFLPETKSKSMDDD